MKWLAILMLATVPLWAAEKHLWDGKDLTGWARIPRHEGAPPDQKPGFAIRDGQLVSLPDSPEDDLWYTAGKIGNATLRVVYRVSAPEAYKYALLLSLADIAVESGDDSGGVLVVPASLIAGKYIAYYWRHAAPYVPQSNAPSLILRQIPTDRRPSLP